MTTIYIVLAVCLLMTSVSLIMVQAQHRRTSRLLKSLKTEWDSAESQYGHLAKDARDKIRDLGPASLPGQAAANLRSDTRARIQTLARNGTPASEIARRSGLPEGEVEVVLGMASLR